MAEARIPGCRSFRAPRVLVHACLVPLLAILLPSCAGTAARPVPGTYELGLCGDVPYSAEQVAVGVPHLIADMNARDLAFSVHVGDLKAGSGTPCDDMLYARSKAFFDALEAPAMFTPGDNDWADCDRPSNGTYSPRERLDHERAVFATPDSVTTLSEDSKIAASIG